MGDQHHVGLGKLRIVTDVRIGVYVEHLSTERKKKGTMADKGYLQLPGRRLNDIRRQFLLGNRHPADPMINKLIHMKTLFMRHLS